MQWVWREEAQRPLHPLQSAEQRVPGTIRLFACCGPGTRLAGATAFVSILRGHWFSSAISMPVTMARRHDRFSAACYGSKATIRTGAPVPPLIFIGNASTVAPFGGSRSSEATFSNP